MPEFAQLILGSLVLLAIAASLMLWLAVWGRVRAGMEIVPAEPRRPVPWNGLDLLLLLSLYIGLQIVAARVVFMLCGVPLPAARGGALTPEVISAILLSNAMANIGIVLVAVLYLQLRFGPLALDLGFLPWRPLHDVSLGVLTFLAAVVPVFTIQALVTRFVPSEHPVQQLLTENSSLEVVAISVFTAVIVAPLAEEFLFRVLLQGWLEAAVVRRRQSHLVPEATAAPMPPQDDVAQPAAAESEPPVEAAVVSEPGDNESAVIHTPRQVMKLPIVLSSLSFALVHYPHGSDPIPLFVLAMMLGYVYQKTHRIWPSLVVHACLNAWSLTVLIVGVQAGGLQ